MADFTAVDYICLFAMFLLVIVAIIDWIARDYQRSRRDRLELPMLDAYRPKTRGRA